MAITIPNNGDADANNVNVADDFNAFDANTRFDADANTNTIAYASNANANEGAEDTNMDGDKDDEDASENEDADANANAKMNCDSNVLANVKVLMLLPKLILLCEGCYC